MSTEKLYEAITLIDDDLIDEAGTYIPKKRKVILWKRWAALAACLVLVVGVGSFLRLVFTGAGSSNASESPLGSAGEGFDGGSTFMSYVGPVFPLATLETADGLTAQRDITLDFLPWASSDWIYNEEKAAKEGQSAEERKSLLTSFNQWTSQGWKKTGYSTDLLVTDGYTLTNTTTEDKTLTLLYPFVSDLMSVAEKQPTLTLDGVEQETELLFGLYAGGFQGVLGSDDPNGSANLEPLTSWEDYNALLSDGSYLQAALADPVDLTGVPVTVYEFTNAHGNKENGSAPNPSVRVTFDIDYDKTTVLSYGFHAGSYDEENNKMGLGFSIPQPGTRNYGKSYYIIVLGDDVENMEINGYVTGGWDTKKKLDDFGVDVQRYEDDLDNILRKAVAYIYDNNDWQYGDTISVDFETYYALYCDFLTTYGILSEDCKDRYDTGWLSGLSEVGSVDRVCYLQAQVTIPAGSSTEVRFTMEKAASFDYHCAHSENQNIKGYDLVTQLGSTLSFTSQNATLLDHGLIEIVRQNFGLDPANGIRTVELDPAVEHYYLEAKRAGN